MTSDTPNSTPREVIDQCAKDVWPLQLSGKSALSALTAAGYTLSRGYAVRARGLKRAHETLPGISTPMMMGDNLAIVLCTVFDDGEEPDDEDETGWSASATRGYEEVVAAIRAHYDAAVAEMVEPREGDDPEEAYALGKRDGFGEAVQHIDMRTGGDGEYTWSSDPARCVDESVMIERIVARTQPREGWVMVPVAMLKWWRGLAGSDPKELASRIDAMIAAAPSREGG